MGARSKENMLYEAMGQQPLPRPLPPPERKLMRTQQKGIKDSKRLASANKRGGSAEYCPMSGSCRQTSKRRNNTLGNFWLVADEVEGKEKMRELTFITNNPEWPAFTTCQLYQFNLGVEVFFKEIKQTLQLADSLGYNENAVRWQIWTALLAHLLLRFVAWHSKWKHPFRRLFTRVRSVLWNFFLLASLIECCDTVRERRKQVIRGSPETACQLTFFGII